MILDQTKVGAIKNNPFVNHAFKKFVLIIEQTIRQKEKLLLINIVQITVKNVMKQQKNQAKNIQIQKETGLIKTD